MKNEIIIFEEEDIRLEVSFKDESVWLSQLQMVDLFKSSKGNVSDHIKNIFLEKELSKESTVRKFRTVQEEGKRRVTRSIEYYSLDVVISVGYRVKSKRGTQFRIWANRILKEYLLQGYVINPPRVEYIQKTTKIKFK